MLRYCLLVLLFLGNHFPLLAKEPDWQAAEIGVVERVVSGNSLQLQDGRHLRLAHVRVPRAPLTYQDEAHWRRQKVAQEALETHVRPGDGLLVLTTDKGYDRHRRLLVYARTEEGLWLQQHLLSGGYLLLEAMSQEVPAALQQAEREAMRGKRGLWSDPAHAIVSALHADRAVGRFSVIEGRVVGADEVRGLGYLNFAEDWREDFTIRLPRPVNRQLADQGRAIQQFAGQRVRVRGWVFYSGGPMIEVKDLAEIVELAD